jgi:hypothetical protein
MNIGEARAGIDRGVVYAGPPKEVGVITSVNSKYVFVRRYGNHKHSQATNPCDLEFEFPEEL